MIAAQTEDIEASMSDSGKVTHPNGVVAAHLCPMYFSVMGEPSHSAADLADSIHPQLVEMLDLIPDGYQVIGPELRYLHLNGRAVAHARKPLEELTGVRMDEAYPGIEQTEVWRRIVRVMETGTPDDMESEFTFPDGSVGWFDLRMVRMGGCVVVRSIDITQRKILGARLVKAQRLGAAGQLAGGMAHDFNNMLTTIGTLTELAMMDPDIGVRAREDLERVIMTVRRAGEVTRKMLDFTAERTTVPGNATDLGIHLSVFAMTLDAVMGARISLEADIERTLGRPNLDPAGVEQLVMNLAINARDATKGAGRIWLDAKEVVFSPGGRMKPGRYAEIRVRDEGAGMSPETQARVFEPFFTTKGRNGTGIGMATCYRVVRDAGGSMEVTSELGAGTSVTVLLPLVETAADSGVVRRIDTARAS